VSDAGSGLARGVKLLNDARAATTSAPEQPLSEPVQSGFDVFHTARERQRIVSRRWASAAKGLETASQADEQVAKAKQRGIDARGAAGRSRQAWRQAEGVFDQAVAAEAARNRLKAALALWRPDGQRNDRAWAQQQIRDTISEMGGEGWGKVRRLLQDPRKPGHDILAIRGDLRRSDLEEKSLPLRTENPLFFSYIIILGPRSMRLKPGRLNSPPAERVLWPGLTRGRCITWTGCRIRWLRPCQTRCYAKP
jgi:hypothetical protein